MKVVRKQPSSLGCFVCGVNNGSGLGASFYEMENGEVYATFSFKAEHASYPGRAHGGAISALLDELIGRAIWAHNDQIWGVTLTLSTTFRKPVPLNKRLVAHGRILSETSRGFVGSAEIVDEGGNILAEAKATYLKMPLEKIGASGEENIVIPDGVEEIE